LWFGVFLIVLGLTTQKTSITEYEQLRSKIFKTAILFLLSHHTVDKLHRCLKLKFKSHRIYLCARCSGGLLGFIVGMLFIKIVEPFLSEIQTMLLASFTAIPALLDWSTQKLKLRESTNIIRVMTGFLLGLGSIMAMLTVNILLRMIVTSVFLLIFVGVTALAKEENKCIYIPI